MGDPVFIVYIFGIVVLGFIIAFFAVSLLSGRAMSRQNKFLAGILEGSSALIIAWDDQQKVVAFNEACEKLTGLSGKEINGMPAAQLNIFPPETFSGPIPPLPTVSTWKGKDGREVFIQWHFSAIEAAYGQPRLIIASGIDVTRLNNALAQVEDYSVRLRTSAARMANLEEEERRKIAQVLHDRMGQDLSAGRMTLNALKQDNNPPEMAARIEDLSNIFRDIIQSSRELIAELSPRELYKVGLQAALKTRIEYLRDKWRESLEFEGQLKDESDLPEHLPYFLYSACGELLHNAHKHASGSEVVVSLFREEGHIVLQVSDNGPGFDPVALEESLGHTSGFGLFYIRDRTRYFGGRFEVQSQPGEGSEFNLIFPTQTVEKGVANA